MWMIRNLGKMPLPAMLWRLNLKLLEPEKYAEILQKEKERSKRRWGEKKQKWEEESHTRAALEKRAHELHIARFVKKPFQM